MTISTLDAVRLTEVSAMVIPKLSTLPSAPPLCAAMNKGGKVLNGPWTSISVYCYLILVCAWEKQD